MSWLSDRTGINIDFDPRNNAAVQGVANTANRALSETERIAQEAEKKRLADEAAAALKKRNEDSLAAYTKERGGLGPVAQIEGTGTSMENAPEYYVKSANEFGMFSGVESTDQKNPWTSGAAGETSAGAPANQGAYPAMANDYGLGQAQPTSASSSSPGYASQDISVTVPDSGSRGFNPWSLQGEALSRR